MSYLEEHYKEIFKKYSTEELLKDIHNYKYGKGRLSKVLNHFFEEEMFKCVGSKYSMSPMQALSDDAVMDKIISYTESKPRFYNGNEISNVKSYLRNGGNYARKVANFCPKNARDIYWRYFDKGDHIKALDMSMGFGSRMSAVLITGGDYCGFDPNRSLFEKIERYKGFLKENNVIGEDQECTLYCEGSEIYEKDLDDSFDVSFTSPPYFNLEIYDNDGFASSSSLYDYDTWINNFVKPTIDNTYKYLKPGGYAMINIKNLNSKGMQPLFDDWLHLFTTHGGFEFVEVFEMYHQSKRNFVKDKTRFRDGCYSAFKEPIMSFKKTA